MTPLLVLTLTLALFSAPALAFPGAGKTAAPANAPTIAGAKGTVVETMNSGGYTYLLIENEGQKKWAAIPKTEIKVGQEVELAPGMTMKNFTSKTLGRTFDAILFSRGATSIK